MSKWGPIFHQHGVAPGAELIGTLNGFVLCLEVWRPGKVKCKIGVLQLIVLQARRASCRKARGSVPLCRCNWSRRARAESQRPEPPRPAGTSEQHMAWANASPVICALGQSSGQGFLANGLADQVHVHDPKIAGFSSTGDQRQTQAHVTRRQH